MSLRSRVKRGMRTPDYVEAVKKKNADTDDIIHVILLADKHHITKDDTADVAEEFLGTGIYDTCYNIWKFVVDNIDYRRDAPGRERVKSPSVTFFDGYADCKSMSLWVASCLRNLGIRYKYRFTGYAGDKYVTHVYVVAFDKQGKEIIIDATYDKFDEEVAYLFKKDKMSGTTVSFIHRNASQTINPNDLPLDERKERTVSPKTYLNYSVLTEGEARLAIMDERLKLYAEYLPENASVYNKGRALIANFLQKGLHVTPTHFGGIVEPELYQVLDLIKKAKRRANPAGRMLFGKSRNTITKGIGNDFIEELDCAALFPVFIPPNTTITANINLQNECALENLHRRNLNEKWEEVSPHVLYEFLNPSHLQGLDPFYSGAISAKQVLHQLGVGVISDISTINRTLLSDWTRLGIERSSANSDAGLMSPEQAIAALKEGPDEPGVGIAPALIAAIATVLAAALTAAAQIYGQSQATERQRLQNEVKGWGLQEFSAGTGDFPQGLPNSGTDPSGGTGTGLDNLLSGNTPIIIGAALLGGGFIAGSNEQLRK